MLDLKIIRRKPSDIHNHRLGHLPEILEDRHDRRISLWETLGFGDMYGKSLFVELKIEYTPIKKILLEFSIQRAIMGRRPVRRIN